MTQTKFFVSTFLVALLVACVAPDRSSAPLDEVPGQQIYHEWSKVYNLQIRGATRVRQHVGFLHRRFSDEDPQGKHFVLDRTHEIHGYILPSGAAFAYAMDGQGEHKPLGSSDLDHGIKRILKLTGQVEVARIDTIDAETATNDA